MDEIQLKKLFGQRIKQLRKNKKLTQEELAELIWMDPQHFCKMENGSHFPSLKNLIKLATALDIEVKDLFCYNETEHNATLRKINSAIKRLNEKELKFLQQILTSIADLRNN